MRIHAVRTQNLNSLYGEQTLDLDRDLAGQGLFLIHGETGAGKSTLLDAVSLALFARTARLDGGSRSKDAVVERDPALVLSEGTARARAEVDFSVLDGGTRRYYRARWSVARAHGRADGRIQRPERTLYRLDAPGAEPVLLVSSDKEKDTAEPFDAALCGLTYEDFSRTVLLAQGQFQLFLRATHKERAELLERLTGTHEYAEIGARAARRRQALDVEVATLEARIGGITLPGEDELAALRAEQARLDTEEIALARRDADLRGQIAWLDAHAAIRAEEARRKAARESASRDLEAFAPARQRLTLHRRTEPAEGTLRQWRSAGDDHRLRTTALGAARERLAAARQDADETERCRSRDAAALAALEREAAAAETLIRGAREAWSARDRAAEARDDGAKRHALRAAELRDAESRRDGSAAAQKARHAALEEVKTRLVALDGADALIPRLPEWRGWLSTWREAATRGTGLGDALDQARARAARARDACTAGQREAERATQRQAEAARELGRAAEDLGHLTLGADAAECREGIRRARSLDDSRRQALDLLLPPLREEASKREERAGAIAALGEARTERDALVARHAGEREALLRQEERLRQLAAAREQVLLVLEIVTRRGALCDHEACPLCGSVAHPYRDGSSVPPDTSFHEEQRDSIGAALAAGEVARREAFETEQRTTRAVAAAQASVSGLEARVAALDDMIRRIGAEIATARMAPALEGIGPDGTIETLSAERDRLAGRVAEAQTRMDLLERAIDAEGAARHALAAADRDVAEAGAKTAAAEAEAALASAERASLETTATECTDACARFEQRLTEELARQRWIQSPIGGSIESVGKTIDAAERRLRDWESLRAERDGLDAEVRRHEATVERDRTAAETLAQGLTTLREELVCLEHAATFAATKAAACLDGRSPDEVEQAWSARLGAARKTATESDERHRTSRLSLEGAMAAEQAATAEESAARKRSDTAGRALAAALAAIGLGGVEEIEMARLEPGEHARLVAAEKAIDDALQVAEGGIRTVEAQREASLAARPPTLPDDVPLDRLVEEERRLSQARRDVVSRLGEIRTTLSQAEELAGKLAETRGALAERRREAERWRMIDDLIGTADGSRFRRLAQGYHLVELAGYANCRLAKLTDRYRLCVPLGEHGAPTMDFLVQDAHQADRERPLTTLSGGETFLVSLALALALADFRAVRMPIETVLIDEGFGTLDPVTLNTVVQALETLQTSTKARVGIISHVGGLSERIGGRVLVERVAAGRSRIVVEPCG
jgi:exonuclease SbcC